MGVRFVITLVPMRGIDGVRALRWLLKRAPVSALRYTLF